MRVLICSPAFPPSVGGLERVAEQIAAGLAERGDEVVVVAETPAPESWRDRVRVVRRPSRQEELALVEWSDVIVHFNVSLRHLGPILRTGRPWVATHHGRYGGEGWKAAILGAVKRHAVRWSSASVAVSQWVAAGIPAPTEVIANPYRDDLFRRLEGVARDRDIIFVGRLVSDKGAGLLISALALLRDRGLSPRLTIVGGGPEEQNLRRLASELGIADRVSLAGTKADEDLVRTMNGHRLLVVPSLWPEPFGVVALEGLACGCGVVASDGGGLPEAVGACGRTFRSGDAQDLARALAEQLSDQAVLPPAEALERHLAAHRGQTVVDRYRSVLSRVARRRS